MKITFLRIGHANNSSSNHSIVFFDENEVLPPSDAKKGEYGWDYFTLTDKEEQKLYIKMCLMYSFKRNIKIKSDQISWKEAEEVKERLFSNFVSTHFPELSAITINSDDYVDHQSVLYFPENRISKVIDLKFARKFINYFLARNFVILGGNDNDEIEHKYAAHNKDKETDFRNIWSRIRETESIVVYDDLNDEFVLRFNNGNLMKIIFHDQI